MQLMRSNWGLQSAQAKFTQCPSIPPHTHAFSRHFSDLSVLFTVIYKSFTEKQDKVTPEISYCSLTNPSRKNRKKDFETIKIYFIKEIALPKSGVETNYSRKAE